MDDFGKVERLSKVANVSFDDANQALIETNWDLLDAIVLLEKQGKTVAPDVSHQSTNYEEMPPLPSVQKVVDENQKYNEETDIRQEMKRWARIVFDFIRFNSFHIRKNNSDIAKIPVWLFVLIILIAWHVSFVLLVVGLFFGIRYSFTGKDDMTAANNFMEEAGNLAEKAKEHFRK